LPAALIILLLVFGTLVRMVPLAGRAMRSAGSRWAVAVVRTHHELLRRLLPAAAGTAGRPDDVSLERPRYTLI
jgi:hypothetical protein